MKGGSSPVKVRQWRARLLRFQESGQTVAEFCRKEKVSEASLYRWRKELVNRVASSRSRTPSADLRPGASKSRRSTAPSERSAYRYGHDVAATKSGITLPLCAECEIQVSEADQTCYERIRAMLGADKATEEPTAKEEEGE